MRRISQPYRGVISLRFDDASSRELSLRIDTICVAAGLPALRRKRNEPPHVTLAVFDTFDRVRVEDDLTRIVDTKECPSARITHIGAFESAMGPVYWGLAKSRELVALNRAVYTMQSTRGRGCLPNYLPSRWVPHCTIVTAMGARERARLLTAARSRPLPMALPASIAILGSGAQDAVKVPLKIGATS